jgi:hypothetical protein
MILIRAGKFFINRLHSPRRRPIMMDHIAKLKPFPEGKGNKIQAGY